MNSFIVLVMTICFACLTPFLIQSIRERTRWERYCLEQRKAKDRKEAE